MSGIDEDRLATGMAGMIVGVIIGAATAFACVVLTLWIVVPMVQQ